MGPIAPAGDLTPLAEALRTARRSGGEVPLEATKYVASDPSDAYDPSMLIFEAWCRFGDRAVDPLLAVRAGIQPLPEVFPDRLELEFNGDPNRPWFRRGKWTSSPVLSPASR